MPLFLEALQILGTSEGNHCLSACRAMTFSGREQFRNFHASVQLCESALQFVQNFENALSAANTQLVSGGQQSNLQQLLNASVDAAFVMLVIACPELANLRRAMAARG